MPRPRALIAVLGIALALASCQAPMATSPRELDGDGVFTVPAPDGDRHRLRFVDGQLSRNDSCVIRLTNNLNPRVPPMYVNGEPVGFC